MQALGIITIFVACLAFTQCQEARIVGGAPVADNSPLQFEFAVSLQTMPVQTPVTPARHVCGGALINWGHVITSATCCFNYGAVGTVPVLKNANQYRVMAGIRNTAVEDPARTRNVQEFRPFPGFIHRPSYFNDIAIIVLGNVLTEQPRLAPISAVGNFIPFENMVCHVAGFGSTIRNPIVGNPPVATYDDGNVLVCNNLAVGVLTYYHGQHYGSFPEVYTRTANYTAWIRENSNANVAMPGIIILCLSAILTIFTQ